MKLAFDNLPIERSSLLKLGNLFANEYGTCLLYSGGSFDSARFSFLFLFPYDFIWIKEKHQYRKYKGETQFAYCSNPWDALLSLLPKFDGTSSIPEWVGFFGYEMGAFSDPEKILPYHEALTPDAYFQRSAVTLCVDHQNNLGKLYIVEEDFSFLNKDQKDWIDRLLCHDFWKYTDSFENQPDFSQTFSRLILAHASDNLSSYILKVEQAKELIRSGDLYQINLSQQFLLNGHIPPYKLFYSLASENPAPFSAFMTLTQFSIVSSSPERFLKKIGNVLETRPIKGTIPRGKSKEEDKINYELLLASQKEKAELFMITDLMRNDLGRISSPGSVKPVEICKCEAYTNVFHLLSIIQSVPLPHTHSIDLIRACFPGGSITGCPKLSAIEAIYNLEKRPRGIYTGSIGYLAANGDFDFNIAIRTVTIKNDTIDIQLGGGIVYDSIPEKEYEETLHKGASIFKILKTHLTHQ